jgi:hypothetical protein
MLVENAAHIIVAQLAAFYAGVVIKVFLIVFTLLLGLLLALLLLPPLLLLFKLIPLVLLLTVLQARKSGLKLSGLVQTKLLLRPKGVILLLILRMRLLSPLELNIIPFYLQLL